jgi:hypothetical protein
MSREFLKCITSQKAQKIQKESNSNSKEAPKQNKTESARKQLQQNDSQVLD